MNSVAPHDNCWQFVCYWLDVVTRWRQERADAKIHVAWQRLVDVDAATTATATRRAAAEAAARYGQYPAFLTTSAQYKIFTP